MLQTGWLWRDMFANALPTIVKGVDAPLVWRSLPIEALAGPITFEAFRLGNRDRQAYSWRSDSTRPPARQGAVASGQWSQGSDVKADGHAARSSYAAR